VILSAKDSYFAHSYRRIRVKKCPCRCSSDSCPVLALSLSHSAFPPKIWLLFGNIAVAIIRDSHFSRVTEGLLHLLVLTAMLPRLTARRAATIEPTIQEPITKVRALKNRPPSNSTVLSSMRTSLRLYWRLAEARLFRIGAQITVEPCVLNSSQLSDRGSLAPQRTQ
jgi:hypothetical protein